MQSGGRPRRSHGSNSNRIAGVTRLVASTALNRNAAAPPLCPSSRFNMSVMRAALVVTVSTIKLGMPRINSPALPNN